MLQCLVQSNQELPTHINKSQILKFVRKLRKNLVRLSIKLEKVQPLEFLRLWAPDLNTQRLELHQQGIV